MPEWGRFLSEDPIGFAGGLNRYVYAGNNPLRWVDYNGTAGELPGWARGVISGAAAIGGMLGSIGGGAGGAALGAGTGPGAAVVSPAAGAAGAAWGAVKGAAVGAAIGAVAVGLIEGISDLSDSIMEARRQGGAGGRSPTVREMLKDKRGSIKNAELDPGSPSWDDIMDLTLKEIEDRARQNLPGYKTIKKLLTERRFDK